MFNLNEKYFSISERCGRNHQNKFCLRLPKRRFCTWELRDFLGESNGAIILSLAASNLLVFEAARQESLKIYCILLHVFWLVQFRWFQMKRNFIINSQQQIFSHSRDRA